jgi:hypothetical protein
MESTNTSVTSLPWLPLLQATGGGGEPSDAVRAVNALLTQLDLLRRKPNVMVLTTSNITQVEWGLNVKHCRLQVVGALRHYTARP